VISDVRTERLQVSGWTINAALAGEGPSVLLLHGLGMSWEWWRPTLAALSEGCSVCAVDLPGWGRSSPLTTPSLESYGQLVGGLISCLDAGPTVVVGHSLGGFIAARAAIAGTPGIKALALVAPGGFGQVHNVYLRLLSVPGLGEALIRTGVLGARIFLRSTVHRVGSIPDELVTRAGASTGARNEFLRQLRMGMHLGRTTDAYLIEKPASLPMPVLLAWGRHDGVLPVSLAYHAHRMLGAGPPVIFEESGHVPQLEEPARFNAVMRAFCERVWSD